MTYRVVIRQEQNEAQPNPPDANLKPVLVEDKSSYWYGTPESIVESAGQDSESEQETWYPADIDPVIPKNDDQISADPPEEELVVDKPEDESSNQDGRSKKPTTKRTKKPIDKSELRVSTRTNKGQHNDTFSKKHFTTYVAFVATSNIKLFHSEDF
jgi:hypothetical protein